MTMPVTTEKNYEITLFIHPDGEFSPKSQSFWLGINYREQDVEEIVYTLMSDFKFINFFQQNYDEEKVKLFEEQAINSADIFEVFEHAINLGFFDEYIATLQSKRFDEL